MKPRADMAPDQMIVVTKKEVLRLLGVKMGTLVAIEEAAGISEAPQRMGYTSRELRLLKAALKRIFTHEKIF